jgi:hypothetical protein
METTTFNAIERIVHQGKAVVSSEDSAIIDWVIKTTAEGRTATLYLEERRQPRQFLLVGVPKLILCEAPSIMNADTQ